jgi:hypothetical protein
MSWVELTTPAAELELKSNGEITWNTRLQILLGDPEWVDVMWDSANRHLGIRSNNSPNGLPIVAEPESNEFKLDSAAVLTAANISVANNVSAEPDQWIQSNAADGWADWFSYPPIFYITLP